MFNKIIYPPETHNDIYNTLEYICDELIEILPDDVEISHYHKQFIEVKSKTLTNNLRFNDYFSQYISYIEKINITYHKQDYHIYIYYQSIYSTRSRVYDYNINTRTLSNIYNDSITVNDSKLADRNFAKFIYSLTHMFSRIPVYKDYHIKDYHDLLSEQYFYTFPYFYRNAIKVSQRKKEYGLGLDYGTMSTSYIMKVSFDLNLDKDYVLDITKNKRLYLYDYDIKLEKVISNTHNWSWIEIRFNFKSDVSKNCIYHIVCKAKFNIQTMQILDIYISNSGSNTYKELDNRSNAYHRNILTMDKMYDTFLTIIGKDKINNFTKQNFYNFVSSNKF